MPSAKNAKKTEVVAIDATSSATEETSTPAPAPAPAKKKRATAVSKLPKPIEPLATDTTTSADIALKKTGRKTRGSKIVTKHQIASTITTPAVTNVILNLKCSMSDLKEYNDKLNRMISNPLAYNSSAPPEVKYYDGEKQFGDYVQPHGNTHYDPQSSNPENTITSFLSFPAEEVNQEDTSSESNTIDAHQYVNMRKTSDATTNDITGFVKRSEGTTLDSRIKIIKPDYDDKLVHAQEDIDDVNIKDMSAKIKQLKIQLYKNTLQSEKKSACFWCTYDFDNAPCYIPKYEMDGTIYGYGSFCRPECAVAFLLKENIDDSTKFDRYHLLNQIYSKVYDCKKNIKPAPDPHYLLDKFYGNLTIQEYRRLLKTEHLLLVIDKPLTRILPELHEDTDDAFTKIYGIKATTGNSSGVYKVKRQSEQPQGPSKASIIKNTFGITN